MKHLSWFSTKKVTYIGACVALLAALGPFLAMEKTYADPKCAVLSQGATACPEGLGQGGSECFYFDPGDPRAGPDSKYPGWRSTSCESDVYKEASKPLSGIQYTPDPALKCTGACNLLDKVNLFVNALAALVGIVVVISIVVGGIQYASSGDDPQKVSAAKGRITSALVALFAFFLLYAMLQWLVPGGFLNG